MPPEDGPYLSIAAICERVLREKDEVISLVRVFDRWNVQGQFSRMPVTLVPFTLVITVKAVGFRGSLRISVKPKSPSGKQLPHFETSADLSGEEEDKGATVLAQLMFTAEEAGIYWFEVLFDDKMVTKLPLNVTYRRVGTDSIAASGV